MAASPGIVAGLDQATAVNAGDGGGVGIVLGLGRDTVRSPGRVDGGHPELLPGAEGQDALRRLDLQPGQGHCIGHVEALAFDNPAQQPAIGQAIRLQFASAAMRDQAGPLAQDHALLGRRREGTPAPRVHHDALVIRPGIRAEDAELETTLSLGLAVAAAGITPRLGQDRDDLRDKGDRARLRSPVTVTATRACSPPWLMRISVLPSAFGATRPVASTAATLSSRTL